jgi:hypothetical protein
MSVIAPGKSACGPQPKFQVGLPLRDPILSRRQARALSARRRARSLAKVLGLFAPHAGLLHGHDGGMNKTGTMDGIRTLAGDAGTSSHGRARFVISLTSNEDEMRFRLLRAIESGL